MVVKLFFAAANFQRLNDKEENAIVTGDAKAFTQTQQETVKAAQNINAPLERGLKFMHLLFRDAKTKEILENFANEYYETCPIIFSEEVGKIVGGFIPAIIISAITDQPEELAAPIVVNQVRKEISEVATTAKNIDKTLDEIEKCKEVPNLECDRKHEVVKETGENELVNNAKDLQKKHGYNPDNFQITELKKGDEIIGGLPGQSSFYTNKNH